MKEDVCWKYFKIGKNERGRMLEIFQNWQKQDEQYKTLVLQRLDKQVHLLRLYTIIIYN